MDLDKRIDSIDDIFTPFSDTKVAERYVNSSGYFSNEFENFSDLGKCTHGTLKLIAEHKSDPSLYRLMETGTLYKFFLCDSAVNDEESKFRPFNLHEFLNIFPLGDAITFKRKDETYYWKLIFIGHRGENNGSMDVCIGSEWYSFKELVEDYEYRNESGEWVSFGVEEKST